VCCCGYKIEYITLIDFRVWIHFLFDYQLSILVVLNICLKKYLYLFSYPGIITNIIFYYKSVNSVKKNFFNKFTLEKK